MCASGTGRRVGNSSDLGSGNSGAEGAVESGIRLVFRRSSRLIPVGLARQSFSLYLSPSFSFSTPLLYFSLFLWKQGGYRALFPSELPPLPSSHRGGHVTPALLPPTPAVAVTVAAAAAAAHGLLPGSRAALPASLRLSVCPSSPWWCCREDSRSRHQTRCSVECPLSLSRPRVLPRRRPISPPGSRRKTKEEASPCR